MKGPMVQGQHMRFWFSGPQFESGQDHFLSVYMSISHIKGYKKRQRQDSNLRLQRRSDFQSHALDHSATLSYEIIDRRVYRSKTNLVSLLYILNNILSCLVLYYNYIIYLSCIIKVLCCLVLYYIVLYCIDIRYLHILVS